MVKKGMKIFLSILLVFVFICNFTVIPASQVHAEPVAATFQPTEIFNVLNNPYMGWAPWASGGPYTQPHKLVYINATWRELEPTKGSYAFDALETKNKFSYWKDKGVKVVLRINMDYPGSTSHKDIPDWLYNEINGDGTWYDIDWGKGFSPNYSNAKLISYHESLIKALAGRYNNNPRIAAVAVGSLGHWGEFHTWKSSTFTIPFPEESVSNQYVQHYINYFTNKTLMMRRPFQIAKDNKMGLFNDSFGSNTQTYNYFVDFINQGYRDYLTGESHPSMTDYWKYAPSGGEFANYPGLTYLQDSLINTTLQMVKDSHTSWLGPCSPGLQPTGTSYQNNFDLLLKTMGYRFVLQSETHTSEVNPGSTLQVSMDWENKGVAPFYYKWPLELSLADSTGNIVASTKTPEDIRTWLPGKKSVTQGLAVPSGLAGGTYTLCIGIIDPDTGKPGVDLAIAGKRSDGRYGLGQVKVAQARILSGVAISGPDKLTIPSGGSLSSSYSAVVTDQFSSPFPGEPVSWSITGINPDVSVNSTTGALIISSTSVPGSVTLRASSISNPAIYGDKAVNLVLEPSVPKAITLKGSTYVAIPADGVTYSDYTAAVTDQYAREMTGEAVTWSLENAAAGVTMDSSTGKMIVDTSAVPASFSVRAVLNSNPSLSVVKNVILIYAKAIPSKVEISGPSSITLPPEGSKVSGFSAKVWDQYSQVMDGESIRWSLGSSASGVSIDSSTGEVTIAPGATPDSFSIVASAGSNPGVSASQTITVKLQSPIATSISITGSTYVQIPLTGVTYSDYKAVVKDQYGQTMGSETVIWSLSSPAAGVELNSTKGKLTVYPEAQPYTPELKASLASNPSLNTVKSLKIIVPQQ